MVVNYCGSRLLNFDRHKSYVFQLVNLLKYRNISKQNLCPNPVTVLLNALTYFFFCLLVFFFISFSEAY